jgi:hypothetical protein
MQRKVEQQSRTTHVSTSKTKAACIRIVKAKLKGLNEKYYLNGRFHKKRHKFEFPERKNLWVPWGAFNREPSSLLIYNQMRNPPQKAN